MMKKLTALLLALTMLLSMTTAFAWSCPSCGSDNGGKFCTECGTKKPEDVICPSCGTNYGDAAPKFCMECGQKLGEAAITAAPTATPAPAAAPAAEEPVITYATQLDNGTIGFMWEADGKQTYTVEFILKQSDDPYADKAANGGFNVISGTNADGIVNCAQIIPGEDYWLGLFDEQGRGHYAPFEGNATSEYTELDLLPLLLPQRLVNGELREMAAYSLEEIEAGETCALYFGMLYKNPGEKKEYTGHMIIETPNGVRYPIFAGDVFFEGDCDKTLTAGWNGMNLTGYFEEVKRQLGEVPLGEYKVSMYLDMAHAFTQTFRVQEKAIPVATATPAPTEAPFEINGFAPLGDGSVELAWMGGTAPYDVQYCIRMSESIEDDYEYAAEMGFLQTAHMNLQENGTILYELIPDEKYWIVVADVEGKRAYAAVKTLGGEFTDFATELVLSSNPVDAEADNVATDFQNGFYTGFVYDNPGEAREMLLQCVVDCGNGRKKVTEVGRFVAQSGKNSLDLGTFDSRDAFLEALTSEMDFEIEADVTLSIYLDGKLAGQAVIPVEKTEPLGITGVKSNGNGTVTLTWKGSKAPYIVCYHVKRSEDYQADLTNPNGTGRWIAADGITDTSYTLTGLVPGVSYWLTVFDAEDTGWYASYTASPAPQEVPGITASLEVVPKSRVGENVTDIDVFPVDAIGVEDDTEHGASIVLHYNNAGEERKAFFQVVYTLPGGATLCRYASEATLYSGSNGIGWYDFISMEYYLSQMRGMWGGFTEGDLKVEIYLDGCLAGSAVIPMGQPAPQKNSGVEITGIVENADGTATVTWTDAYNCGPYEIDYVQKLTDDYEADRNTGTGSWYDTKEATGGSYTLHYLTPGQAYWVAVYDANGYGQHISYEPAAAQAFTEFTLKMELTPIWRLGTDMKVSEFSSAEIGLGTSEHGLEMWIGHPQLARTRNYLGVVSITSPDGSRLSVDTSDWQLDQGEAKSVGWRFFDLAWYFGVMTNNFGAVPVGTYTVEFFCDGELACSSSFRVTD